MKGLNHTELIQHLIDKHGYKSYLEIGLGDGVNFINVNCERKVGIDPLQIMGGPNCIPMLMTSDEYFDELPDDVKFDAIFIDGLHEAYQCERDIVNAWKHLKPGGCIVIHDINPTNEQMQRVPRETHQWTGDVWRCWVGLVDIEKNWLDITGLPQDYGIGVIMYHENIAIEYGFTNHTMTFGQYQQYKSRYFVP